MIQMPAFSQKISHKVDCDDVEISTSIEVFLHFGDTRVKVGESSHDLRLLADMLMRKSYEIDDGY